LIPTIPEGLMLGTLLGMGLGQVVTPAPTRGLTVDWSPVPADTVTLKSLVSSLGLHASKRLPCHKYR
jgi:hypothetical protein